MKIFTSISEKGFLSRLYEELLQLHNKTNDAIRNGQKIWKDDSHIFVYIFCVKKICKCPTHI